MTNVYLKKVFDEGNPYLREIWALGYEKVIYDLLTRSYSLLKMPERKVKVIPERYMHDRKFKLLHGVLPDGSIHSFIRSDDGSCEEFIKMIESTPYLEDNQ